MNPATVISLVSLGIVVVTFVVSQLAARKGASKSYVAELEAKVEAQGFEIVRLENRVRDLEAENLHLMRKLLANGH